MELIAVHPIILYSFLFLVILLFGALIYLFIIWNREKKLDMLLFIDKSNRWAMVRDKLLGLSTYTHNGKKYLLADDCGILSYKGKSLFIFSENKPAPLNLKYNESKWLTSDSIMSILNNDLIQKLVKTSDSLKDNLILFGAIGGLIAGISSVIILLKQFGVI